MGDIKIDDTFKFYLDIFNKRKLFKRFKHLESDLHSHYSKIKEYNYDFDSKQGYLQEIKTNIKDDFYTVAWSISKIDDYIQNNKVRYDNIPIERLFVDYNNINPNKFHKYLNTPTNKFAPIYVTYYFPIKSLIVIDGNHRTTLVTQRNEKFIKGTVLNPYSNRLFMDKKSLILYSFHHNLFTLYNLCRDLNKWKYSKNLLLEDETYYSENTQLKFNWVKFNKVRLLLGL